MMIFVWSFYMLNFVKSWWNDASKSINHITSVCLCVYVFFEDKFYNLFIYL